MMMTEIIDLSGSGMGAIVAFVEVLMVMGWILATPVGDKKPSVVRKRKVRQ